MQAILFTLAQRPLHHMDMNSFIAADNSLLQTLTLL